MMQCHIVRLVVGVSLVGSLLGCEGAEIKAPTTTADAATTKGESAGINSKALERGIVYLGNTHNWLFVRRPVGHGMLPREFFRQALLLAARDELGLITRDGRLGDPLSAGEESFDLHADAGPRSEMDILYGPPTARKRVASEPLPKSERDYMSLLEYAERLSRGPMVAAIQKVGYQGTPNRLEAGSPVPDGMEALLAEMTYVSQFGAVRALHEAIRAHGESPARLGALVRAYANLGVLTEFHWAPAHKVFKARALLYAQRMVARGTDPAWAKWHRAYALALTGLHRLALEDIDAAEKEKATGPAERRPSWVTLLRAYCRFDLDSLEAATTAADNQNLAHLFATLATDLANRKIRRLGRHLSVPVTAVATKALAQMPDCVRIHEVLFDHGQMGVMHQITLTGPALAAERIYKDLHSLPGVPEEPRRIADRYLAKHASQSLKGFDFAEEVKARATLTGVLLAGEASADNDRSELTWNVLGHLIREWSFTHVWRRANFERHCWNVDPTEFLEASAPLVAEHPYRALIECHAWDRTLERQALERVAQIDPEPIELQAQRLFHVIHTSHPKQRDKFYYCITRNMDDTAREKTIALSVGQPAMTAAIARHLLDVSPYSPAGRAALVEFAWEEFQAKAAEWEEDGKRHPMLLLALGQRYLALQRYADAERCLKAALPLASDTTVYQALAEVYQAQGKLDQWQATLDAFLETPSYGLDHGRVCEKMAWHFLDRRQWEKALPYAKRAAATGAAWGMIALAAYYEVTHDWDKAEALNQAIAERYRTRAVPWFCFCKRTGRGDVDTARRTALAYVKSIRPEDYEADMYDVIVFHLLDNQPKRALEVLEQVYSSRYQPTHGLMMALLADQLKDTAKRDATLKTVVDRATAEKPASGDEMTAGSVALSGLLIRDLSEGGKGQFDPTTLEDARPKKDLHAQINFDYYLGKYLELRGQSEEAIKYWNRCVASPRIGNYCRVLAAVELQARKLPAEMPLDAPADKK